MLVEGNFIFQAKSEHELKNRAGKHKLKNRGANSAFSYLFGWTQSIAVKYIKIHLKMGWFLHVPFSYRLILQLLKWEPYEIVSINIWAKTAVTTNAFICFFVYVFLSMLKVVFFYLKASLLSHNLSIRLYLQWFST